MYPVHDDKLLDILTELFQKHGYEGANLSRISEATGLARASLYHRFPGGKEEMAEAVLARAEEFLEAHALAPLTGPGSARERIRAMAEQFEAFYAGGSRSCLLDALSFGDEDSPFRPRVAKAMAAWIDSIEALLIEAGVPPTIARNRAEDAVIKVQGALVVARASDDKEPFSRVLRRLDQDLLAPVPVSPGPG